MGDGLSQKVLEYSILEANSQGTYLLGGGGWGQDCIGNLPAYCDLW